MLLLWNARRAGLTDDDLRAMKPDEASAWLELWEWVNDGGDEGPGGGPEGSAERSKRAFFHM